MRQRSLRRANLSSKGVLRTVACLTECDQEDSTPRPTRAVPLYKIFTCASGNCHVITQTVQFTAKSSLLQGIKYVFRISPELSEHSACLKSKPVQFHVSYWRTMWHLQNWMSKRTVHVCPIQLWTARCTLQLAKLEIHDSAKNNFAASENEEKNQWPANEYPFI